MSHFLLYTLVMEEEISILHNTLEKLMEPYNQNHDVEPYDKDCYCKEHLLNVKAREKAEKEMGSIEQWRERYEEENGVDWPEYITPFINRQEQIKKELQPFTKPEINCETCGGTGLYKSTYNPNSKWDWYEIGGRWNGAFSVGIREFSEELHYKNSPVGNIALASELDVKNNLPYALLSPRGWHEPEKMLFFGMSVDEKEEELWEKEVQAVYKKYPNHFVVAIDCHI